MSQNATPKRSDLLKTKIRVPRHVVYRVFPSETVVLNLQTGKYHGLNPSAGRMLEELERSESVTSAAAILAAQYEQAPEVMEGDVCELCSALLERNLIETESDAAA